MTINRRDLIALSAVTLGGIAVGEDRAGKANFQSAQVLRLWPNMPPGAAGKLPQERFEERVQGGVSNRVLIGVGQPQLECVRPRKPNGAALLVIPGGAYIEEWIDKEDLRLPSDLPRPASRVSYCATGCRERVGHSCWMHPCRMLSGRSVSCALRPRSCGSILGAFARWVSLPAAI